MIYFDYFLIFWMLFANSNKKILKALSRGPLLGLASFLMPIIVYFFSMNFKFQMILIYISYIFFVIFYLTLIVLNYDKRNFKTNINKLKRIIINISIITIVLIIIFPIGKIRYDLGEFNIGTKSIELTNNERKDLFNEESYRKLKVRIFFPTNDNKTDKLDRLFSDIINFKRVNNISKKEKFFLDYLSSRKINSYLGVDLKDDINNIPVVILSHKIGFLGEHYIGICEKLASNGYFVVSINHSYLSKFTNINDEIISLNKDIAMLEDKAYISYKKDILDVINLVEKINSNDYNLRLDTKNISLVGHGIGGSSSISIAMEDNRIKNIIAIDPKFKSEDNNYFKSNNYNLLVFKSSEFDNRNIERLNKIIEFNRGYIDIYEVKDSLSRDFTSLEYISPFSNILGITKTSKIKKVHKIEIDFLNNMFFK